MQYKKLEVFLEQINNGNRAPLKVIYARKVFDHVLEIMEYRSKTENLFSFSEWRKTLINNENRTPLVNCVARLSVVPKGLTLWVPQYIAARERDFRYYVAFPFFREAFLEIEQGVELAKIQAFERLLEVSWKTASSEKSLYKVVYSKKHGVLSGLMTNQFVVQPS